MFDQNIQDYEQNRLSLVINQIKLQIEKGRVVADKLKENVVEVQKSMWDHVNPTPRDTDDLANIWQYQTDLVREGRNAIFLSSRVERLEKMLKNPYFARIDFKEDEVTSTIQIYIGISSLNEEKSSEFLVFDWRAPIAGMFYDYELGRAGYLCPVGRIEGEILLKRQYRLWNGKIQFMFDSSIAINDDILQEILGKFADSRMKTIITSIQREQNSVIRNDVHKLLLVHGPAGSGKTSIALHRAAYLLYRFRDRITSENIVIFSPNHIFCDYISDVLPELGEENINRTTFFEYAQKTLEPDLKLEDSAHQMEYLLTSGYTRHKVTLEGHNRKGDRQEGRKGDQGDGDQRGDQRDSSQLHRGDQGDGDQGDSSQLLARISWIKYKSSETIIKELQRYAIDIEKGRRFGDIYLNNELIETGEEIFQYFIKELKFLPIAKRLEKITNRLTAKLDILVRRRIEEVALEVAKTGEYPNAAEIRGRSIFIARREAEPARNKIAEMSELNLLECYKEFFTYNINVGCNANTKTTSPARDICNYTNEAIENKIVYYEDIAPLLLLNGLLYGFPNMHGIKHVIIDEVQDYTPVHLEIFKRLFDCCNMTLLGDPNQAISPVTNPCSIKTVIDILESDASTAVQLSKSYRSTRQIAEFCKNLICGENVADYVNRDGELPEVICGSNQKAMYDLIAENINELKVKGAKSIAIITRTEIDCRVAYESLAELVGIRLITAEKQEFFTGTVIIPSYLSKGLEFDAVLVLCMDPTMYEKQEETRLIYTVCTRALNKLQIYCIGGFPGFMKSLGKKCYKIRHT